MGQNPGKENVRKTSGVRGRNQRSKKRKEKKKKTSHHCVQEERVQGDEIVKNKKKIKQR